MGFFINQFRPRFHITVREAATRFGVAPQELSRGIRLGRLRYRRVMHQSWVTPVAVAAYLDRESRQQHAPWNTAGRGSARG